MKIINLNLLSKRRRRTSLAKNFEQSKFKTIIIILIKIKIIR